MQSYIASTDAMVVWAALIGMAWCTLSSILAEASDTQQEDQVTGDHSPEFARSVLGLQNEMVSVDELVARIQAFMP
jgi:hypothetical protein